MVDNCQFLWYICTSKKAKKGSKKPKLTNNCQKTKTGSTASILACLICTTCNFVWPKVSLFPSDGIIFVRKSFPDFLRISWSSYWVGWKIGNFQKFSSHRQWIRTTLCSHRYWLSYQLWTNLQKKIKVIYGYICHNQNNYIEWTRWKNSTVFILYNLVHRYVEPKKILCCKDPYFLNNLIGVTSKYFIIAPLMKQLKMEFVWL